MTDIGWVKRPAGTRGVPAGVGNDTLVQYRHLGDPSTYDDRAGNLAWGDGPGAILEYRVLGPGLPFVQTIGPAPTDVGDVAGTTLGSAARFNAGKPDLSLIPGTIMAECAGYASGPLTMPSVVWPMVLARLGDFQMREEGRDALLHVLQIMDNDGRMWADCARVFAYGKEKYSAWNWARGQAWSIPVASALRHIVFGTLQGEDLDPESGLPHRGHIACNVVMLLWFWEHFPQGDDRYTPPLPHV